MGKVNSMSPRPRPSSTDDPTEWDITEDGYEFSKGDIVFNYYDAEWVEVLSDPEPTKLGWFNVKSLNTDIKYTLNSIRVCWHYPVYYTIKDHDRAVQPERENIV